MLRTRLWMGTLLTLLALGVLLVDDLFAPWYPVLFLLILLLGLAACYELRAMLAPLHRPPAWLCYGPVAALVVANWLPHLPWGEHHTPSWWPWVTGVFAAVVLLAFLEAMATFRDPVEPGAGEAILVRIAVVVFLAAYLGLFPSFLAQLRWPAVVRAADANRQAVLGLTLAIFVPKCCDIGAYFTGRFLGRHRMTPLLSPKKTWEGLAGGLAVAMLVAVGVNHLGPVLPEWGGSAALCAAAFGLTVGATGVLGDLAESLIKRACRQKDASQAVPGFGGVLDVVDSVVFAAPVSYAWLGSA